ncbi:MAG: HEAT repeat domain-containing protein [Firmicutes bacterium]|nr:HEAT repeat domain-containing protein [Bacillota bacterium]
MTLNEKEERLNDIYLNALSASSDSAFLHQCLFDEDYLLRSKAFYVAERYVDDIVLQGIYDTLDKEDREWQLRALSVLCRHPQESSLPYLKKCLFQREKPLLIRGALLTLSEIGGRDALIMLAEFLLSPYSGYLKDDFLAECFASAKEKTENGEEIWLHLEEEQLELAALSSRLQIKVKDNELLMVYPYPDYLSRMAEKQGFTPKEWKKASFFPRKKSSGRKKQ